LAPKPGTSNSIREYEFEAIFSRAWMLDLSAFATDDKIIDPKNLDLPFFGSNCSPTTMAAWRPLSN